MHCDFDRNFVRSFPIEGNHSLHERFYSLADGILKNFAAKYGYSIGATFSENDHTEVPAPKELNKLLGDGEYFVSGNRIKRDTSGKGEKQGLEFIDADSNPETQRLLELYLTGIMNMAQLPESITKQNLDLKITLSEQSRVQQEQNHKELMTAMDSIHEEMSTLSRLQHSMIENLKLRQMYAEESRQKAELVQQNTTLINDMQKMKSTFEAQMEEQTKKMQAEMDDMKKKFEELQKSMQPKPAEKHDPAFL